MVKSETKTGDEKYFSELNERILRHRCYCGAETVAGAFCVKHDAMMLLRAKEEMRKAIARQVSERFDRWAGLK